MNKIYGNTVGTTTPRSDWNQTDETKADYIKNKPELGELATKDKVEKSDLSAEIIAQIESGASADLSDYSTTEEMNSAINAKAEETLSTVENTYATKAALDGKANSSHGTHVSYSTTNPVMDGTASVGSASTVARSDHKHPTDTSRASASALTTHTEDTTAHITSTERTNWNNASTNANNALAEIAALKDGSASLPGVDHAVKADKDGNDQNIASTYIKGLSVSGKTVTYTKGNDTTGTITINEATKATQDGSGNVITDTYATKATYNAHKHTFTGSEVTSKAASTTSGHTASIYSITGVGTLPSHTYTAPSLSGSVSNRCLTLTWSAGSHSFSAGTLPTRSSSAYTVSTSSHTHGVTAAGSLGTPT